MSSYYVYLFVMEAITIMLDSQITITTSDDDKNRLDTNPFKNYWQAL